MTKNLTIVLAVSVLTACATYRPCETPERPELAVKHSFFWARFPILSLTFDGAKLSITTSCSQTWCVPLAESDARALRQRLAAPDLRREVIAKSGSECVIYDVRYLAITLSDDGGFEFCHEYMDLTPQVKSLIEFVDELANKYFGWRYGYTFTKGPTSLQRLMANGYRCRSR